MTISPAQIYDLSQAYAFLGNSLLKPMNQTDDIGAQSAFWAAFPDFDDAELCAALDEMYLRAERLNARAEENGLDAKDEAGVEFTHLFVGPPSPAAAPWESIYRALAAGSEEPIGFGQATFQMQEELRALDLEISNENNQYADHIGIELLCASVYCQRLVEKSADDEAAQDRSALLAFLAKHPADWIDELISTAEAAAPKGYVPGLLMVAKALMSFTQRSFG